MMTTTQPVFARWERLHPYEAAADCDPRDDYPCRGDGCQTFAWRGYEGLCGWCHDERLAGDDRPLSVEEIAETFNAVEVDNAGDWKAARTTTQKGRHQ